MGYSVYVHRFPNGKLYVGATRREPELRWAHGMGYSSNIRFSDAVREYGWDSVEHVVISCEDEEEMYELEWLLIGCCDSTNPVCGYNLSDYCGVAHSFVPYRISQLSMSGKELRVWDSVEDIESELGLCGKKLLSCCRGKRISYAGCLWRFVPFYDYA